jgi:hypothetical protein
MNGTAGPQNVWQFLLICFNWVAGKITRGLATLQGILALLIAQCFDADGKVVDHPLIPVKWIPWIVFGSAVLFYLRGQVVSNTISAAQTIVAQSKVNEVPLTQTLKEIPK